MSHVTHLTRALFLFYVNTIAIDQDIDPSGDH